MTEQQSSPEQTARATLETGPDAHGQAAMLLVESLIHGLLARSVLTVEDAIEIVAVASEVKEEVAAELGDSPATMQRSLALLGSISTSLSNDLPKSKESTLRLI
jgi:hypothetical protein